MAYGDQPAIICELVDWAKACGFEIVAAGKGMNYEPRYRYSTPDTVWGFFGWSDEEVAAGDFNPKMYNSFTDGTKAAIEMAAVANATGLDCPDNGLEFPLPGCMTWRGSSHRHLMAGAWVAVGLWISQPVRSLTDVRCLTISATAFS